MTGAPATRITDIARLQAERNERVVFAESALLGERRVAIARVVMAVFFGISDEIISTQMGGQPPDRAIRVAGGIYLFFAIVTLLQVYRVKPTPRRSLWIPIVLTLVDFAAVTFFAWRDYERDLIVYPEMGAIALAILITFSVARLSILHVALSTALACICYVGMSMYFELGATSLFFVTVGFIALGFLIGLTNRAVRSTYRDLRRRDELTRLLPTEVAERLLRGGEAALAPVQREITVLFSDIRGFTSLSENKEPTELFDFLDHYFGQMVQIVRGNDGVVNKFLGDGLLAFWGAPNHDEEHAAKAVRAALDMCRAVDDLNRERAKQGESPIHIGIGIHTGTVAAGLLGGSGQSEYTVIGDAVNVASRVESLTKNVDGAILITEQARERCGTGLRCVQVGSEPIRGRAEPVVLYTVTEDELDATAAGGAASAPL